MLRQLCIIIDQDSLEKQTYFDYKTFKCNGFNQWYESHSVFPWVIRSYDPNYDDVKSQNK